MNLISYYGNVGLEFRGLDSYHGVWVQTGEPSSNRGQVETLLKDIGSDPDRMKEL